MRQARRWLAAAIPVLVGLWPLPCLAAGASPTGSSEAKGGSKVRCAAAYEQAQELRRQNKLLASRSELLICKETCPRILLGDCQKWLTEVEALMPTVIFRATDAAGKPVAARVLLDGEVFLDGWTEAPVSVDSGEHTFRFESASGLSTDVHVSLHTGERGRSVEAVLTPPRPALATTPTPVPTPSARAVPTATYVLGAVGAVTLLAAGGLALAGHVQVGHLRSACAPNCSPASVDTVAALYDIGWASAGVGVVSLGAALLVWRPWQKEIPVASGASGWFVTPTYGGALVGFNFR